MCVFVYVTAFQAETKNVRVFVCRSHTSEVSGGSNDVQVVCVCVLVD